MAYIAAIGCATPAYTIPQAAAGQFLVDQYGARLSRRHRSLLDKVFAHPSIERRGLALDGLHELLSEDQDQRIERFTRQAVDLAVRALRFALTQNGSAPEELTALMLNTCTGYICPGLSTYILEELGLDASVRCFDLVGSGCGGAIPNLELAAAHAEHSGGGLVASVAVEICTATFQMGDVADLIVSNALFGDGAAAALISNSAGKWRIIGSASRTTPAFREAIRFIHKSGQLTNQLAKEVPALTRQLVPEVVADVLHAAGVSAGAVSHWALHPGGDRVVNGLGESFGLTEKQLMPTRLVLRRHGNMSSPTVWFVLEAIEALLPEPGEYCLVAAFGAGFAAHACLLERVRA